MKPLNRHLLIKPIEERYDEPESVIMLPTDYEKPLAPYVIAEVLDFATDCQKEQVVGSTVVLERTKLNNNENSGKTNKLVL